MTTRIYAKATRSALATDAVRETWKARDRADVRALACERDPEARVGTRVDISYCRGEGDWTAAIPVRVHSPVVVTP